MERTRPARLWSLYAGGFLGPFGGAMVTPMLPELSADLGVALNTAGLALSVYLVPFAVALLISGTLAERWGRDRTVRTAYATYALSSVLCAIAPMFGIFLAGRAVQGVANAFVTPVLVAALSDLAPPAKLGRTLGLFGSMQAAGQAFAPFVGGLATEFDWRLAFLASAVAAATLLAATPSAPRPDAAKPLDARAGIRALRRRGVVIAGLAAAGNFLTGGGLTLLGALLVTDRFNEGPAIRGLVVAAFGVAGFVAGPSAGRVIDRIGAARGGVLGGVTLALAAALGAVSPHLVVLVVALFVGGMAGTGLRAVTNYLAVTEAPENRGGAASFVLGVQFVGAAIAPLLWLPLYTLDPTLALVAAGSGGVAAAVLLAGLRQPPQSGRIG